MAKKKSRSKSKPKTSVSIKIDDLGKLVEKAKCCTTTKASNCGGAYCLGALGAAIYYISTATGFWVGVLGVLKALVWPAFLVFQVMKYLGM